MTDSGPSRNDENPNLWEVVDADPTRGCMYLYHDGRLEVRPVTRVGAERILDSLARGASLTARPL